MLDPVLIVGPGKRVADVTVNRVAEERWFWFGCFTLSPL